MVYQDDCPVCDGAGCMEGALHKKLDKLEALVKKCEQHIKEIAL